MILPYEKPSASFICFAPTEQLAAGNEYGQNALALSEDDTVIEGEVGLESSVFGN